MMEGGSNFEEQEFPQRALTVMSTAIHWFRRDLRLTDNTALNAAVHCADDVVCAYVVSSWRDTHRWTGSLRQTFLCGCLKSLDANLRVIGGSLIVREGDPVNALLQLAVETGATAIFFNRDPDPHGRAVEESLARKAGPVEVRGFQDICLHERDEVLTGAGAPFRVFTPYAKAWHKLKHPVPGKRLRRIHSRSNVRSLELPTPGSWRIPASAGIVEPGEKAARARLTRFLGGPLADYARMRNTPAGTTTSRLSQDLRFGLLSIREVFQRITDVRSSGAGTFVSELIWREFFMAILWHFPEVLEQEFQPDYRGMHWPGTSADFQRWCDGETGFPIVDAAMRQLNTTGFMHNRTRMIAAMFLTKDLHLDWRLGEAYFMQKLVDGEIASNNGGWQWSSGTGADAAPYFRIQNPWTQTVRFDPEGEYIKEWVPELRDQPASALQSPPAARLAIGYPLPMLEHSVARAITLDLFAGQKRKCGSTSRLGRK